MNTIIHKDRSTVHIYNCTVFGVVCRQLLKIFILWSTFTPKNITLKIIEMHFLVIWTKDLQLCFPNFLPNNASVNRLFLSRSFLHNINRCLFCYTFYFFSPFSYERSLYAALFEYHEKQLFAKFLLPHDLQLIILLANYYYLQEKALSDPGSQVQAYTTFLNLAASIRQQIAHCRNRQKFIQ